MTEPTDHSAQPEVTQNDRSVPGSPNPSDPDQSTVGTGTFFALGCIAATVVLILIGILIIFLTR